ncbi:MAG: malonyl-CoA decarboxylase family protein [Lentilitoribacter sp.]
MSREDRKQVTSEKVIELCHKLLSSKGEASGIALSFEILDCYQYLPPHEKFLFFKALLSEFSAPQDLAVNAARAFLDSPSDSNLALLSEISEPMRRRLILRLNQADNATLLLIKMREDLLEFIKVDPSLKDVDTDFKKLFTSWFNGGFLNLKRLDWSSSASILEKIIRYEAVHNMSGWDDLRKRLDPPDRHIYGFFHPRLKEEPLIFVEVALTADKPEEIGFILEDERQFLDAEVAKTATFYSISNCQKGLRGIPLGSFLIKQVVEDLRETFPALEEFVTLSPIPGFSRWLNNLLDDETVDLPSDIKSALLELKEGKWVDDPIAISNLSSAVHSAVAYYITLEKDRKDLPLDSVAKFHLGNGARLERTNWPSDLSHTGLKNSFGAMVNYGYRLNEIERNHERFVENGEISTSSSIARSAKTFQNNLILLETVINDIA